MFVLRIPQQKSPILVELDITIDGGEDGFVNISIA